MTLAASADRREVLARARKFLADREIDAAAVIHREDAVHFMMEFSLFEQAISSEIAIGHGVTRLKRSILNKLGES
jgi:hypothetical protein